LGQGHRLVITGVIKDAEDYRIFVVVAQCDRFGAAKRILAFRFKKPKDIRAKCALPGVGPGCLVVGDALARNQQCSNGIHKRGFARADIAVSREFLPPRSNVHTRPSKVPQLNTSRRLKRKPANLSSPINSSSMASTITRLSRLSNLAMILSQSIVKFSQPLGIDKGFKDAPHFEDPLLPAKATQETQFDNLV